MSEKRDCNIVQDLLPNYIEKLTNEETNKYIEEHLANCKECTEILENMRKELKLSANKDYTKETDYFKKFRKRQKILRRTLLFIILVIILVGGNIVKDRMIILYELQKTGFEESIERENKEINEYIKSESYSIYDNYMESETYRKGDDFLTILTTYSNKDGNVTHIYYKKGNEELHLVDDGTTRYMEKKAYIGGDPVYYVGHSFGNNLWIALTNNVQHNGMYGDHHRKRYEITEDGWTMNVEEESGLVYRIDTGDSIVNYDYRFGIVKDSDIVRPDTTGYKLIEE